MRSYVDREGDSAPVTAGARSPRELRVGGRFAPDALLALQRSVGNATVGRLLTSAARGGVTRCSDREPPAEKTSAPAPAESPRSVRSVAGAGPFLALQQSAGNRAVARALAAGPVRAAPSRQLQRVVMKRASATGWKYYSSWAPGTLYDREEDARRADAELEAANQPPTMDWEPETRHPTVYSYTHTKSTNLITGKPQGPHTAPHVLISQAFGKLTGREAFLTAFYEQVPDPQQLLELLVDETGKTVDKLSYELQRLLFDYQNLYEATEGALWNPQVDTSIVQHLIRQVMELHPYGTYAWKSKKAASHKSLKGKGESTSGGFRELVDAGGKWRKPAAYEKFLNERERLCNGTYQFSQEELEYDGQLDGEYMTMDELVGAVVVGQEVVGNTIRLYPTGEWRIVEIKFHTAKLGDEVVVTGARVRLRRRGG